MTIAAIAGYSPSPYEIGGSDLTQAKADIAKLKALKVTANDYKDADATHGWWGMFNMFSDKSDKQALIGRQTQLEDDASKHLFNIAAANERGEVSPALLKEAQTLAGDLQNRLRQDDTNASAADTMTNNTVEISPLSQAAYDRANPDEDHNLQDALALGNKPDAIPLSDTPSFMSQVNALDSKITSDINTYQHGATPAERAAAKTQLTGVDTTKLTDFFDQIDKQTGFMSFTPGTSGPKIASLPDGDPQKTAYIQQANDLINLVRGNGTLLKDNNLLSHALG